MRMKNFLVLLSIILLALTVSSCTKERYFTEITGFWTCPPNIKTNEDVVIYATFSENRAFESKRYFVWKIDEADEIKTVNNVIETKFTTAGQHNVDVWVEYVNKDGVGNEFIFPVFVE